MKLLFDDIKYKKHKLLTSGELVIVDNGINVITGKNGVGKTSLVKNIFNRYQDIALYVDQENDEIIHSLSIIENIAMSDSRERIANAQKFLESLNLTYLLGLNIKKLSGGEKRIINIVRGLLSERSLIIIDEPTNDLDYNLVEKLIRIISAKKSEKTFLIISHDDRIHKISDSIFNITLNNIVEIKKTDNDNNLNEPQIDSIQTKLDDSILKKSFSRNLFPVVAAAICIIFLSVLIMHDINQTQSNAIPLIEAGQVEIFSPLSTTINTIDSGAYPISVMILVNDTNDAFNYTKIQDKLIETNNMPITFGLNLSSSSDYDVYPIEYYDPINRQYFYTLDECVDKILNLDNSKFYIDSSEIFAKKHTNTVGKTKLDFSDVDFKKTVDLLNNRKNEQGKNLEKLSLVLKLKNGYSFYDFLNDSEVSELQYGNYYIRSNETITLTNQLSSFNGYKRNFSIVLCSSLMIILLLIMYTFTYCLISSKKISIFKNYGYEKDALTKIVLFNYSNSAIQYLVIAVVITINFILLMCYGLFDEIGNHMIYIVYIVSLLLSASINKTILKNRIKKVYRWNYR